MQEKTKKKTVQAMKEQFKFVARSRNHCCCGKAISITYSECLSILLFIQHAMLMRHIVTCDLSGSTIFFHLLLINGKIFGKNVSEHKMWVF
jgi:hypothetical protein